MSTSKVRGFLRAESAIEHVVERDIRAELESHLELCIEELVARGSTPEQARKVARERFGDLEKTVHACRRQKLGARIMLQRLNLVMTTVLLIAVLFLGVRSYSLSRGVVMLDGKVVSPLINVEFSPLALEEVIIHRGDSIEIRSEYNAADLNVTEPLASDGTVLLPELGHVLVAGMTRDELELRLDELYSPHFDSLKLHVKVHKGGE